MISALIDLLGNFYTRNDFSNFEVIARSIQSAIPNDPVSLQFLGLVYYRTGRIKDAIRIFDKVFFKRKTVPKAKPKTGNTELAQGEYAITACYEEATRNNPELAQAWYDLGKALVDLRKHDQALSAFRSALTAKPDFPQAMREIGETALRIGDLTTAEDGFSRLRTLQPNNDAAYWGLGRVYRRLRHFASARSCFVWLRLLKGDRAGIDNLSNRRNQLALSQ